MFWRYYRWREDGECKVYMKCRHRHAKFGFRFGFIVFNATFNNISVISWWSISLVEETGVHGENQDLTVASH
jgi:hypothetical protein